MFHEVQWPAEELLLTWYACGRKQRFDVFAGAEEHAQAIERTYTYPDGRSVYVLPYECYRCNGFHVCKPPRNKPVLGESIALRSRRKLLWNARGKWLQSGCPPLAN